MTAVLIIFSAATWGALIYFVVVEPVRWFLDARKPHPQREAMDERAASSQLYPTTERTVVGQPATPFDLNTKRARGGDAPGLSTRKVSS